MAIARFSKLKSIAMIVLIIGAAWAFQTWFYEDEIIRIDGKMATVIDGDSFKVADQEYRLYGIDAPEYRQTCDDQSGKTWTCGKSARTGLETQLRDNAFSCNVQARDQFGRTVVTCITADQLDLGAILVAQGLAISGHYFDVSHYPEEEAAAQSAKRGIWQGSFVEPAIWRKENPRS